MKRLFWSLASFFALLCAGCSHGDSASPPAASSTPPGKYLAQLKAQENLLIQLTEAGVCVVFLYIPDPSEDAELQAYGSKVMLDHTYDRSEQPVYEERQVNGSVATVKQIPNRCMGGWPYLFPIHDSGAQLINACNKPDPGSGGYAALMLLEHFERC